MSMLPAPPHFVPTLTEVVEVVEVVDAMPLPETGICSTDTQSTTAPALQDDMAQRLLRRAGRLLENRLQEVVGEIVLAHTQTFALRLREEIAQVLRQCMLQAIEQEAADAHFLGD